MFNHQIKTTFKRNSDKIMLMLGVSVFAGFIFIHNVQAEGRFEHGNMHQINKILLDKFDTNKDGKLDDNEINVFIKPIFAKADANNDGKLTEEESRYFHFLVMEEMHKLVNNGSDRHFKRIDENGDGFLSLDEVDKAFLKHSGRN